MEKIRNDNSPANCRSTLKTFAGEIKDLTGLQDPYEEPENPEVIVNTEEQTLEECVNVILNRVLERYKTLKTSGTQENVATD
jgi:hypothetical protein